MSLLIVSVVVLSACSGDETGDLEGGTAPATEATGERTLTVMLADDWAPAPAVVEAAAAFEADHEGVTVELLGAPFGQLKEAVTADREGPQDIDLSQWHAFAAGALGYALPITERFNAAFPEGTFVPGALADVSWGQEIYGVPLDVNAVTMIVNTTVLDELGFTVDDLATWDGVREVAEAAAGVEMGFTHLPASSYTTYGWVRANGADFLDVHDDGTADLHFDDPGMVETFEFLGDLATNGRLAIPPDEIENTGDGYGLFRDQHILTYTTGSYNVARLIDAPPDFEYDVIPMPVGPSGDGTATVLGGSSVYVAEQADDPALAFEFATYLIRPEYSLSYAMVDGRLPPTYESLEDPFFDDPRYAPTVAQLPNAAPVRSIAFDRVEDRYVDTIFSILEGSISASDALADLQVKTADDLAADLADAPPPLAWAGPTP